MFNRKERQEHAKGRKEKNRITQNHTENHREKTNNMKHLTFPFSPTTYPLPLATCYLLLATFFLTPQTPKAQEWSEPITVYSGGTNYDPDFAIDSNGHLHVVWAHKIEERYWKIYYSKSTDQGQTWTTPYDLAQNQSLWLAQPCIAVDAENKIYVTYDYNCSNEALTNVHMQVFDGETWSQPIVVSEGMNASWYSKLAVSKDNKIYIAWYYYPEDKTEFRVYQNGIFTDIGQPAFINSNWYSTYRMVFDNSNKLHCVAQMLTGASYYSKLTYFTYENSTWSDISIVADTMYIGEMALNGNDRPRNVWWGTTGVGIHHTFYNQLDEGNWTPRIRLAGESRYHAIIVEKNNSEHIVQAETVTGGYKHMHYIFRDGLWNSNELSSTQYTAGKNKLLFFDTTMYLIYKQTLTNNINEISIYLRKCSVESQVGIQGTSTPNQLQVFPNPSKQFVAIRFNRLQSGLCKVEIFNMQGQMVFGEHIQSQTNAFDINTSNLGGGVYILTIQTEQQKMATKLVITK